MLKGPQINPVSGKPDKIIIFMHGVGSDGENLLPIADFFVDVFPNGLFIAPNGPEDFMHSGPGYQWFQLYDNHGQRLHRSQLISGVEHAAKTVSKYITELLKQHDLPFKDVILVGFSQGSMTAIQTAITMPQQVGAVVAFSGGLIKDEFHTPEIRSKPPICLIHGEKDDVVPIERSITSAEVFEKFGIPHELHKIAHLAHSIDINGINLAKEFLRKL